MFKYSSTNLCGTLRGEGNGDKYRNTSSQHLYRNPILICHHRPSLSALGRSAMGTSISWVYHHSVLIFFLLRSVDSRPGAVATVLRPDVQMYMLFTRIITCRFAHSFITTTVSYPLLSKKFRSVQCLSSMI